MVKMWIKLVELTLQGAQQSVKKIIKPFVKKAFEEQEKATSSSPSVKLITIQKTIQLKSDNPPSSRSLMVKKEVFVDPIPHHKSNERESEAVRIGSALIISSITFAIWAWREKNQNSKHEKMLKSVESLQVEIDQLKNNAEEMKKRCRDLEHQILLQKLVQEKYPSWFTYLHSLNSSTTNTDEVSDGGSNSTTEPNIKRQSSA
uniref:Uncharacterized protein n=1 Tax=Solanum tuberosum TaxID=4113 RepID=M1DYF3_SOLTU